MADKKDQIPPIPVTFDQVVNSIAPKAKRKEITDLPIKINSLASKSGQKEITESQGTL